MEFVDKMNEAMNYIEMNINKDINYETLGHLTAMGSSQFQRVFSMITNVSLAEYIRRRRLTLAAFELQNSKDRILDIAIKYGYESHEAFTRAFIRIHGIAPSMARLKGTSLKAYPPITFKISIKGVVEMNYKIEVKPAFSMFGIERVISMVNEENFTEIPNFWQECFTNGSVDRLVDDSGIILDPHKEGPLVVHGIMCYKDTGKDTFPYMIGSFVNDNCKSEGYEVVDIPEATWAVFRTENYTQDNATEPIQNLWKQIFSEWFPKSGYKHADLPELEVYCKTKGKEEYCEVWIPVK